MDNSWLNNAYSLDMSDVSDESRASLEEGAFYQIKFLAKTGILDLFGTGITKNEIRYVARILPPVSAGVYEMDLGQLVAFILGATAALECAATRDTGISVEDMLRVIVEFAKEKDK